MEKTSRQAFSRKKQKSHILSSVKIINHPRLKTPPTLRHFHLWIYLFPGSVQNEQMIVTSQTEEEILFGGTYGTGLTLAQDEGCLRPFSEAATLRTWYRGVPNDGTLSFTISRNNINLTNFFPPQNVKSNSKRT